MKAKTWIQIALAVTTGIGGLSSLLLGLYILGGPPGPFFIGGLGLLIICGMLISSLRSSPKVAQDGEAQKSNCDNPPKA